MKQQFLTFILDNQLYGIQIQKVREINRMTEITHVPNKSKWFIGVMNLRGSILPVISLRIKMDLEQKQATKETCLIVAENQDQKVSIIVDAVRSVIEVEEGSIESITPGLHQERFIQGFTKHEDKIIAILNPEVALSLKSEEVPLEQEKAA